MRSAVRTILLGRAYDKTTEYINRLKVELRKKSDNIRMKNTKGGMTYGKETVQNRIEKAP